MKKLKSHEMTDADRRALIERDVNRYQRPEKLHVHWGGDVVADYAGDLGRDKVKRTLGRIGSDELATLQPFFEDQLDKFRSSINRPIDGSLDFRVDKGQLRIGTAGPPFEYDFIAEAGGWNNGTLYLTDGQEYGITVYRAPEIPVSLQAKLVIYAMHDIDRAL